LTTKTLVAKDLGQSTERDRHRATGSADSGDPPRRHLLCKAIRRALPQGADALPLARGSNHFFASRHFNFFSGSPQQRALPSGSFATPGPFSEPTHAILFADQLFHSHRLLPCGG